MTPILTLQFLTLVFFFFMMGQGIIARDLKVELQDEKHVDEVSQHSHDFNGPYITGYVKHKVNKLDYITGYGIHTHESNGPYITAYGKHETKQSQSNGQYKTSYGKHEIKEQDYDVAYKTHAHEPNGPYVTAYGGKHETKQLQSIRQYKTSYGKHETKEQDYDVAYKTHAHETNGPYVTAYGGKHETQQSQSIGQYKTSYGKHETKEQDYDVAYKTHAHESNGPYVTAYGKHEAKQSQSNGPYITSYGNHETKEQDYDVAYKTHAHEPNEPYVTAYGKHETEQSQSTGPYITSYGNRETREQDYDVAYKTHAHDPNGPYITAYGKHETKEKDYDVAYKTHAHEPNGPYVTAYGKQEAKDLEIPSSSILDHTEAFKIGFFNLDDIYAGNVMTLQFPVVKVSPYLSKKDADSIPLSISQLPSILQLLSIPEDSPEANSMRRTLEECEAETITGETKTCVNSLESMIEFVDTIIGSNTKHNILTTNYPSPTAIPLQQYTILEVSHDIDAPKWVSCHPLAYPYAIYYCHHIATGTKVFKVTLVGEENGDKMEALGICHLDTSDWNPDHIIFKQLGIKAGKNSPVCHFLPVNHLLWIPLQDSKVTM